MSLMEVSQPSGIAPVSAGRKARERLRDALDPLWRRVLWLRLPRDARRSVRRAPYETSTVQLDAVAAARAEEIFSRRLKP